jgi:hypothetical protein
MLLGISGRLLSLSQKFVKSACMYIVDGSLTVASRAKRYHGVEWIFEHHICNVM